MTHCPVCGREIVGKKAASSQRVFSEKLLELENELLDHQNNDADASIETKYQQKIASFIINYPIPTSSEDIIEFFLLAQSHINSPDSLRPIIQNAWLTKYEQLYQKAKISMDYNHFKIIDQRYREHENNAKELSARKNRRIRIIAITSAVVSIAIVLLIIILSATRPKKGIDLTGGQTDDGVILSLSVYSIKNTLFNKDDIDVIIDGCPIGTIEHGGQMNVSVILLPGNNHSISFYKSGTTDGVTQYFSISKKTRLSYKIKIKLSGNLEITKD